VIQRLVKRIETVSDPQLASTMRFFAERMKMVVEPTGCLGAAALLHGVVKAPGQRVGVLISGGYGGLRQFAKRILNAGPPGLTSSDATRKNPHVRQQHNSSGYRPYAR
jgi:threo-3-hydroxy-L-aspartate ammonia-lyase